MLLLEILDFDFVLHELLVHFLLVVVQAPPLLLPFANILRVVSSDIVRKLGVLRVLHVCPLQLLAEPIRFVGQMFNYVDCGQADK